MDASGSYHIKERIQYTEKIFKNVIEYCIIHLPISEKEGM